MQQTWRCVDSPRYRDPQALWEQMGKSAGLFVLNGGGAGNELELWAAYGVVIGETLVGGPRRGQPRAAGGTNSVRFGLWRQQNSDYKMGKKEGDKERRGRRRGPRKRAAGMGT